MDLVEILFNKLNLEFRPVQMIIRTILKPLSKMKRVNLLFVALFVLFLFGEGAFFWFRIFLIEVSLSLKIIGNLNINFKTNWSPIVSV